MIDAGPNAFACERFSKGRQIVVRGHLKGDLGELRRRAAMQDDAEIPEGDLRRFVRSMADRIPGGNRKVGKYCFYNGLRCRKSCHRSFTKS